MTARDITAYGLGVVAAALFVGLGRYSPEAAALFALVWAVVAAFAFARHQT